MQKVEFKVGEEVYFLRMPNGKLRREAREYKDKVFKREMLKADAIFNHQVYNLLKTHGIWTEEKENRLKEVAIAIDEKLRLLSRGKTEQVPTIERLREIIIKEVRPLRFEQFALIGESRQFDDVTVESIANRSEIEYLTCFSLFTETDDHVYSSIDDFYAKIDEKYTQEGMSELNILIGNVNKNWQMDLPENKLLKKHGLINENGDYLLNGKIVDYEGRPLNEKGFLVNEAGEQVNEDGLRIDDNGEVIDYTDF